MKIGKRIALARAAGSMVMGGAVVSAQAYSTYPGQDPGRKSTCPSTYGCMWKDYDYESWDVQAYRINFQNGYAYLNTGKYRSDTSDTGLNTGSSFANNGTSGKSVCFYTEVAYTGSKFCLAKGATEPGYTDWRNDNAESVKFQ